MKAIVKKFWSAEQAEGLSEYALLLALVVLTSLAAMKGLGGAIDHFITNTSAGVTAASSHQSITTDPMPDGNKINTKAPSDAKDKKLSPMS